MKSIINLPAGTTVVMTGSDGEQYCLKPIEGEIHSCDDSDNPKSMIWIDGEWEYSYIDISSAENI